VLRENFKFNHLETLLARHSKVLVAAQQINKMALRTK